MRDSWFQNAFFQLMDRMENGMLEVVCPRQTFTFGDAAAELRATLVIHDERFFRRALLGSDIGMGESFMDGDWSSPDLAALLRLAVRNAEPMERGMRWSALLRSLLESVRHRLHRNTLSGSRRNISLHYDIGNDFYRLFLDPTMAYSCAYFTPGAETLEAAQRAKYELICRKLDLKSSDHLLEIGTGWGGFAAYAATHYGCRITTTTISRQQYEYAAGVFRSLGRAGDGIRLLLEDYRKLSGRYDKIVSIEMFEAVGWPYYDAYFGACQQMLAPGGCMLLQTITIPDQRFAAYRKASDWIRTYIFPGGELAAVGEIMGSVSRSTQFSLAHAEDLGIHYAETLRHWKSRFLAHRGTLRQQGFDERFLRMWEFYLAYCEAAFAERSLGLHQLVLTRQEHALGLRDNSRWQLGPQLLTAENRERRTA